MLSCDWCVESDWSTGFDDDDRNLRFGQIRGIHASYMEFYAVPNEGPIFPFSFLSSFDFFLIASLPLSPSFLPLH